MIKITLRLIIIVCFLISALPIWSQVGSDLDLIRQEHCYQAPSGERTSYFNLYYQPTPPGGPLQFIGRFLPDGTVYTGAIDDDSDGFCDFCTRQSILLCDDPNDDGNYDDKVKFWRIVEFCEDLLPVVIGEYTQEMTASYEPVAPFDCCEATNPDSKTEVVVYRQTGTTAFAVPESYQSWSMYVQVKDTTGTPTILDHVPVLTELYAGEELHFHTGRGSIIKAGVTVTTVPGDSILHVFTRIVN